jgi:hypothetical protein
VAGSALTSWADPNFQHVIYLTGDGHVHELYFPIGGSSWAVNDLTQDTGAPSAVAGSALTSWADPNFQHVIYLTADGHVHELYFPIGGGFWATGDLVSITNSPPTVAGGALTSWADPTGGVVTGSATVPDVVGDLTADAVGAIRSASLTASVHSQNDPLCENLGMVIRQSPLGGKVVRSGLSVNLWVGTHTGPCP